MSSRRAASLAAISSVARALGDRRRDVVFVGGTVPALYPLEGGADVRPTVDVDCVVDLSTTAAYYAFVDGLRKRGFQTCVDENAPLCRPVCGAIRVDVVTTGLTGIGPTNRWYRDAVARAESFLATPDVEVLAISPVYFVATKLEALRDRGRGDYLESHDLEDILTVLSGLPSLRDSLVDATLPVAIEIRRELVALRELESFIDAIPGHFEGDRAGQARAGLVLSWLESLPADRPPDG